jgi:hypothetical protein
VLLFLSLEKGNGKCICCISLLLICTRKVFN